MITGIGTDIVEVDRIAASIQKEAGFREMVFSKKEIDYCESKTHKYQHYAARFAAKEAFLKAVGTGWRNQTAFNEIEITNDVLGKPGLQLTGETAQTIAGLDFEKILVSLSHIKFYATAMVIIEK